jgi:SnoaL-like domain
MTDDETPRASTTRSDAASFVDRWARVWNGPESDPDLYMSLQHPGCVLINPVRSITREGVPQFMKSVLEIVPDMRVVVTQWTEAPDGVFIEWVNTGTAPGGPYEIRGANHYLLRDGKAYEGTSYFDPRPLLAERAGGG